MHPLKRFIVVPMIFVCCAICAQLPIPSNLKDAYDKGTRTMDGKPGKNYWQNSADYNLQINFDPSSRLLTGSEEVDYVNNSPDTLQNIIFKLYPNLYKKGSAREMPIKESDLTDGVKISSIAVDSKQVDSTRILIEGTNMILRRTVMFPKQKLHFSISWSYTLNKTSHIRTGEIDPGTDFIAYSFPRIAVYDDAEGWNFYPYNGSQEFYNDFCHFKASITVPNTEVVWATGNLLNAKDVLSDKIYQRLMQAQTSDEIVTVIDSTDVATATNHSSPSNTWHFEADSVTDFAFACSDHYMWRSSSVVVDKSTGRRTRVDAAFNPLHKDYIEVINFARETVQAMSYSFVKWPYPYTHESVFDGLDQMEYPMMVNDNPVTDRAQTIQLTDHEIFHTMFPFYMGVNETRYAWMDEGWATIGEWLISPMIDSTIVDEYGVEAVESTAGSEDDLPIITPSTELTGAYFTNSYPKPAMGYLFVKDLLGDNLFFKALHYYVQQWHGKHPLPLDFFNCMNTGSGKNLNWFWKKWFYDNGIPDLAISKVVQSGNQKQIIINSVGNKPVPVDLVITFSNGISRKIHQSAGVWEKGNKTFTVKFADPGKILRIELGSVHTPDSDKSNNVWQAK